MLAFIAILFIISITFLLGWQTRNSVPDEPRRGGAYLWLAIDILLLLLVGMALYGFGQTWAALLVIVFIAARKLFPYLYAPALGIVLGLAVVMDAQVQLIIFTLALVFAFLLGLMGRKRSSVLLMIGMQAGIAFLIALALFVFRIPFRNV